MSPDMAGRPDRLVLCSKSTWAPAMRREHAFARQAAAHGLGVDFIESPADVRALRDGLRAWSGALGGRRRAGTPDTAADPLDTAADPLNTAADPLDTAADPLDTAGGNIAVWRRSAPLPGHRGSAARRADCALLGRVLRSVADPDSTVVAMLPWQWGALAGASARRRVFDCADNWAALIPHRAVDITEQFARIAAEADEIVVTSPLLAPLFPGRDVRVVRNGADASGSAAAPTPLPGRRRLAYVGTLSERFDAALLAGALDRLPPGWSVDLYGPCLYAGLGDRPGADLRALLDRPGAPVRWHGPLARADLAAALDAADVLVLPNRTALAHGQSSMKMYDYAARGRPVVTTALEGDAPEQNPPDVHVGSTPAAFAAAVLGATAQLPKAARAQVAWAQGNTWAQRWPAWAAAVLGAGPVSHGAPAPAAFAAAAGSRR